MIRPRGAEYDLPTTTDSQSVGEWWSEFEIWLVRGDLTRSLVSENESETKTNYLHPLDISRGNQAKSWKLRAATRLARLWQSQGKTTEALVLLAPLYEWFTEGFDTADLKEAKLLLVELS